jgi:hypothetical protein
MLAPEDRQRFIRHNRQLLVSRSLKVDAADEFAFSLREANGVTFKRW